MTARLCLKVPDQVSNDMILGTGAYKAGYNSVIFRARTDAGLAWLKADGDPQVVRTYYLDLNDSQRIAARARAMRERIGVLSGFALGLDDERGPARDVLADLLAVFAGDAGMHWGVAADRLAESGSRTGGRTRPRKHCRRSAGDWVSGRLMSGWTAWC